MSGGRGGPIVVKVGGGLLAAPGALERVARAVAAAAVGHRLVVVPGGGPFADAVRRFDAVHGLSPAAAHWMAILAQDQYAYALADRIPEATLASDTDAIRAAHATGRLPVLAPYRWMLAADVLPREWDATSDSVAAFLAGALDADVLVLVKPVSGSARELTDACFAGALPAGMPVLVLGVEEVDRLGEVLSTRSG